MYAYVWEEGPTLVTCTWASWRLWLVIWEWLQCQYCCQYNRVAVWREANVHQCVALRRHYSSQWAESSSELQINLCAKNIHGATSATPQWRSIIQPLLLEVKDISSNHCKSGVELSARKQICNQYPASSPTLPTFLSTSQLLSLGHYGPTAASLIQTVLKDVSLKTNLGLDGSTAWKDFRFQATHCTPCRGFHCSFLQNMCQMWRGPLFKMDVVWEET